MKTFLKSFLGISFLFSCNEEPKPITRPSIPLGADTEVSDEEYPPSQNDQGCVDEETGNYDHGGIKKIRYYKKESAAICENEMIEDILRCNNGTWESTLENKENYFKDCKSSQFLDCEGLKHAQTETQKLASKISPDSDSCQMQEFKRTCNNGEISPWIPQLISCQIEVGKKSCRINGKEIPHGTSETRDGFKSPAPLAGKPCQSITQTRTCNDGNLSTWKPSGAFFAQCSQQNTHPEIPQSSSPVVQSSSLQTQSSSISLKKSSKASFSSSSLSSSQNVSSASNVVATQCLPSKYPSQGFSDISTSKYKNSIILAAQNGLFAGYSDYTFKPQNTISREEIVSVIVNILSCMPNIPLQSWKTPSHTFTDVSSSRWSHEAITIAKNGGIIAGRSPSLFEPESSIKKGELASMAFETIKKVRSLNRLSIPSETLIPSEALKTGYQDISSHWAGGKITYLKMQCSSMFENSSSFSPDNNATREWASQSIYHLMLCLKNQTR